MASRNSERKSHTRLDEEQLLRDHRTLVEMEKREKKRVRRAWHWGTFRHVLLVLLTLILAIVTIVVMVVGQFLRGPSPTAGGGSSDAPSAARATPNMLGRRQRT